jgi:hypothetical protein
VGRISRHLGGAPRRGLRLIADGFRGVSSTR